MILNRYPRLSFFLNNNHVIKAKNHVILNRFDKNDDRILMLKIWGHKSVHVSSILRFTCWHKLKHINHVRITTSTPSLDWHLNLLGWHVKAVKYWHMDKCWHTDFFILEYFDHRLGKDRLHHTSEKCVRIFEKEV